MSVEGKSTIFVTIAASAIAGTVAWYNTIRSVEKVKGNAENIAVVSNLLEKLTKVVRKDAKLMEAAKLTDGFKITEVMDNLSDLAKFINKDLGNLKKVIALNQRAINELKLKN